MLAKMNDQTLIELTLNNEHATDSELDLAERLRTALAELDRMIAACTQWEDDGGSHS